MGVVRKQGILSLIATLAGFAIGAANTVLFNQYLTQEEYGLTGIFREVFFAFSYIATFGTYLTFHRFYPLYNHYLSRERNDLPFLVFAAFTLGLIMVSTILWVFKENIVAHFQQNSPLFVEKYFLIFPLTVTFLCTILLEAFLIMLKRSVANNLVRELGFRLFQSVIIILFALKKIDIDTFFLLFAFMYVPSILILLRVTFANQGIQMVAKISPVTKRVYKTMVGFTAFHFSSTLLTVAPTAINSLLITSISPNGLSDTAVYIMARFFVSVLEAPLRAIANVNIAMLSEAFHKRDFKKVGRLYKKTSINLLIAGIILFVLIYTNIDSVNLIFEDKDYTYLGTLFLILGTSKLFELSMGMNNTILYLSKHWKTDFYTSSFIILLSIPVNYFLIKQSPLLGAAIGEALMLVLFCLLRLFWVNKLLKIKPYTIKTIGVLIIGLASLFLVSAIPTISNLYLDVAVRTIVFSVFFTLVIWFYKPSEDLHDLLEKMLKKVKK